MSATSRGERAAALQSAQVIAFLYSILFFVLISSGYYLLFHNSLLLALGASIVFPCLAWWLAKFVGSTPGGIRAQPAYFALLLLISAAGVFNSLMLNLEGRHIFVETIEDSYDRFDRLKARAVTELSKGGSNSTMAHIQRVEGLKAALFSEIRNPLNCGQGPEARKIVGELRQELPEFRPLSARTVDCTKNSKILDDYETRIEEAIARAPWSNQSLLKVAADSEAAKKDLDALHKIAGESFAPRLLSEVKPQLQVKNGVYRDLRERLPAENDAETGLPQRLDLQEVESLGEWSQLIYLIVGRLDKPTTYVYLLLAWFADWMMVRMFAQVRASRPRRPDSDFAGGEIGRGF